MKTDEKRKAPLLESLVVLMVITPLSFAVTGWGALLHIDWFVRPVAESWPVVSFPQALGIAVGLAWFRGTSAGTTTSREVQEEYPAAFAIALIFLRLAALGIVAAVMWFVRN